jgi:hypothetical protein
MASTIVTFQNSATDLEGNHPRCELFLLAFPLSGRITCRGLPEDDAKRKARVFQHAEWLYDIAAKRK